MTENENTAATVRPVQPELIGPLSGNIITYCGLVVAGMAAIAVTDRFFETGIIGKAACTISIIAAISCGPLALLSQFYSINHARRWEARKAEEKISSARKLSARYANVALFLFILSAIAALVTVVMFVNPSLVQGKSNDSYLIELQSSSPLSSESQIKKGYVSCYPRPSNAAQDMPARLCIFLP